MAHARRSPQHRAPSSSISSPSTNRRNTLRRAHPRLPGLASSQSISSPLVNRPVLVPLQPNLRRLPSRILAQKGKDFDQLMRDSSHVIQVGTKRKRVVSSNENAHTHGRPIRGSGRLKRLRSDAPATTRYYHPSTSESESEISGMDVDAPTAWSASGDSEQEEQEVEADENESENEQDDSSDDHLIHAASSTHLLRLRKSELIRLYNLTGLSDDPESFTKSDIAHAIVAARDDVASLPPSSPLGRGDGASSDYTSDEGNFAGDEETDAAGPRHGPSTSPLKRHVTVHDLGKTTLRPLKNRSASMGNLLGIGQPPLPIKRKVSTRSDVDATELVASRRRSSTRSSPTTSATTSTSTQSPPATRLRSRKASTAAPDPTTPTSTASKGKSKAKAKQVEFSSEVEVRLQTPSKRSSKDKGRATAHDSESDLTELEELEKSLALQPSPRRLRSKDRVPEQRKAKEDPDATPMAPSKRATRGSSKECEEESAEAHRRHVRITPMRKAKGKIASPKESGVEQDEGDDNQSDEEEQEPGETEEEDEVDELVSSASISPQPESKGRRTPLRRRLRPRRDRRKSLPDGDDENEGDDEEEEEQMVEEEAEEEEEQEQEEDGSQADEDDGEIVAVEPRKLRNGKIVGEEEDVQMEIDEDDVDEGEVEEAGDEDGAEEGEDGEEAEEDEGGEAEGIDVDAEGETDEDEAMEDDVDLTIATAKSLVRLRRDDLVRLCETRDLDPVGTKPQLAEALLQWRDRQGNDFSSPSSAGTVRPSSNRRRRKTKHHSSSTNTTVPVLLRSEQFHTDEPRTPVPGKEKENEELELDLESLGLEDREIPPEKITKLEKIGSGGFKDVFIGKFKGRRIAISEFRGQLSAMDIKELKLLGAFNHPNIVRFLGVSIPENTKETPVMIVSELCSNGDLFDYIRNVNAPTVRRVLNMMLDIARGLEYLHTRKPSIIHRDCKSSNILITAKGTAKIADFGLAKVKQSTRSMVRSLVGTVNWQAPELWHAHPKYNHKVDVFSCAMVYWEMLQWQLANKKFPWEGMNEHAIYEIVGSKRQRPTITGLRKQWCCEIVDLIERMWVQEHQDRPTMSEVVETLEELVLRY